MTLPLGSLLDWDGALTLLPAFLAVALALLTRRVIPSLLAATALAGLVVARGDPGAAAQAWLEAVRGAVFDGDHVQITLFSLFVAGMVGIMGRSGGTRALIHRLDVLAQGRRGTMTASWLAGAVVFFDDYANCLVVGSAMGGLYDRYRVSRAKLAYIVDATAAPLASLAIVSTWVGYEVGLLDGILEAHPSDRSGFELFLAALPYRFYCLFTILFVGSIAWSGKDFGPMREAEQQAASQAPPDPVTPQGPPVQQRVWLAAVPVVLLVAMTFALLMASGRQALGAEAADARLFEVIGAANPYPPMFWSSLIAFGAAASLSWGTGALSARGVGRGAGQGMKAVVQALGVLYLAWTLGDLIQASGAGDFLADRLEGRVAPWALPASTFLLAGLTAFATGSSFFTMGALLPLVVPLAMTLDPSQGPIVLASCAAVLDGAVLGDHASPISDTTILSSIGARVDVVTHVRTQLPYVLLVGAIAVVAGAIPAGLGVGLWVILPVGAALSVGAIHVFGKEP